MSPRPAMATLGGRFRLPRPARHWTLRYILDRAQLLAWERLHPTAPWLVAGAVELLERRLHASDLVVEFGSGRSTLWFARRVRRVVSVEHDPVWHDRVREQLAAEGVRNVDYHLVCCERNGSGNGDGYVAAATRSLDGALDLVLVDGIRRDACALWALGQVRRGGLIVIDNANRYLPHATRSPASVGERGVPPSALWREFAASVSHWDQLWFSNGVTDTAVFVNT